MSQAFTGGCILYSQKQAILTTLGVLEEPLGNARLHGARLMAVLLHTNTPSINQELCRLNTMDLLLVRTRGGPASLCIMQSPRARQLNKGLPEGSCHPEYWALEEPWVTTGPVRLGALDSYHGTGQKAKRGLCLPAGLGLHKAARSQRPSSQFCSVPAGGTLHSAVPPVACPKGGMGRQ